MASSCPYVLTLLFISIAFNHPTIFPFSLSSSSSSLLVLAVDHQPHHRLRPSGLLSALDEQFYFANSVQLSPRYIVRWTILPGTNQTEKQETDQLRRSSLEDAVADLNKEILLELEVETKGWIGFGIGEATSGSMPGREFVLPNKNFVTILSIFVL